VDYGQGPRSGARDNGLRCPGYAMVGDLDPRVADALLETLRSEGIAAYVTPTPAPRGGYLEMQVPSRLTDRLFADAEHTDRARELLPPPDTAAEIDFDSAWRQVLASLQSPSDDASPPWPASENAELARRPAPVELPAEPRAGLPVLDDEYGDDPALEDHFVPPPPPPFPRLRRVTIVSLLAIVAGVVVLVTNFDGGSLVWLAILAIAAGVIALIWHMKEGPPVDSGWDDGAVV
jgi:hypothetical protein